MLLATLVFIIREKKLSGQVISGYLWWLTDIFNFYV
jgi:hypothetical protein